jgi:carboxypeptidase T
VNLLRILVLAALLFPGSATADDFVRVRPGPDAPLDKRPRLGQREVLHRRGEFVDMVASAALREELHRRGYGLEVLQDDIHGAIQEAREGGEYHRYEDLVARLEGWASRRPDLVQLVEVGVGAEELPDGRRRRILAARLGMSKVPRPRLLVFGCVHARELATGEVPVWIGERLIAGAGKDPEITGLLETREIWILPVLNPDGREYVFEVDPWWRKNRSRQRRGRIGVDLNRNFGFQWGPNRPNGGSSGNPGSGIYRGPRPFSEPETRALRDLVRDHAFAVSLSLHSYGEMVLTPYGYGDRPVEHLGLYRRLRSLLAGATGYQDGSVPEVLGYYSNGRHDDWLYAGRDGGKGMTAAIELEIGRTFFPRYPEVRRLARQVGDGVLELARTAGVDLELEVAARPVGAQVTEVQVRASNQGIADAPEVRLVVDVLEPRSRRVGGKELGPLRGWGVSGTTKVASREARVLIHGPARRIRVTARVPGERPVVLERNVEPFAD